MVHMISEGRLYFILGERSCKIVNARYTSFQSWIVISQMNTSHANVTIVVEWKYATEYFKRYVD